MTPLTTLGRYRVLDVVGRGGMGVVYRAEDPVIGREVAVKVVRTDPTEAYGDGDLEVRFEREFKALGTLSHPHIVTIFDVGREGDLAFIAMEYVPGANLEELLEKGQEISAQKAVDLLEPVASALDYAHGMGIVHRDIKPANILLGTEGRPKLTDFGIAKMASLSVTRTGQAMGTPIYMSPEQVSGGEVGGAADQFALAALAYRLITGDLPFTGDNVTTVMYRVAHDDPTPPSQIKASLPPAVDAVLRRALAKKPEERYPTCVEMIRGLRKALEAPVGATVRVAIVDTQPAPQLQSAGEKGLDRPVVPPRPRGGGGRRWVGIVAAIAIVSAISMGAIWQMREQASLPEITTASQRVSTRLQVDLPAGGFELRVDEQTRSAVPESLELLGLPGEQVRLELWRDDAVVAETLLNLGEEPLFVWKPLPPRMMLIESDPEGAEVLLDGEVQEGTTPLEIAIRPFQEHQVELRLAGRRSISRTLSLEDLEPTEREDSKLSFSLPAAAPPATLSIEAPYAITVTVAGRRKGRGKSRRVELPAGEHSVVLSADEVFFRREQKLRLGSGERQSIRDFPRAVSVHIAANPANCRVSIDGRFVDTTPTTQKLVLGEHDLQLEWPALGRSTKFTERILRDGQRIFKSISP